MLARIRLTPVLALRRHYASSCVNQELIDKMQEDITKEQRASINVMRLRSLVKAVETIKKLDYKLTSADMVKNLSGVGLAGAKLVAAHLPQERTGNAATSDVENIIAELTTVHGLSIVRAKKLIDAGCRGLKDLRRPHFFNSLSPTIQTNARYAEHLLKPVTREQTERVVDFMRAHLSLKYEIVPVGSYRRNAATSSSVPLLVSHPSLVHVPLPDPPPRGSFKLAVPMPNKAPGLLKDTHLHATLMPALIDRGLAVVPARLAAWYYWNGVFRVPGVRKENEGEIKGKEPEWVWGTSSERLAEIRAGKGEYVLGRIQWSPFKSKGAALIYATGPKPFLRLLNSKADKLRLHFTPTGLWRWHPTPYSDDTLNADNVECKGEREGEGFWQLLPSEEEEMVFEGLGMEYVEPEKRKFAGS